MGFGMIEVVQQREVLRAILERSEQERAVQLIEARIGGTDCTEDDSAFIKRFFDTHDPVSTQIGTRLASVFPAEVDEWANELHRGDRIRRIFHKG